MEDKLRSAAQAALDFLLSMDSDELAAQEEIELFAVRGMLLEALEYPTITELDAKDF